PSLHLSKVFFILTYSSEYGTFSKITNDNVAIGPCNSETRNQFIPLRFFPCAIPALIKASLHHPTKYPSLIGSAPITYIFYPNLFCKPSVLLFMTPSDRYNTMIQIT